MGSFFGHALPGTFFCLFGCWYLLCTFYYYFKYKNCDSKTEKSADKKNRVAFSFKWCCARNHCPMEGIVKMAVTLIGMTVESLGFFWGIPSMYQHFTMYASFCVSGLIDILLFYDLSVPPHMDYVLHTMSFFIEGLLFAFHLHGRSDLDVVIHTLLVYSCYFCAIVMLAMMMTKNKMIFRIMFSNGVLVQGSWFWQAGQMLYPVTGTKWCEKCHESMMLAVMLFCWHIILNTLFSIILFIIMSKLIRPAQAQLVTRYQHLTHENNDDVEEQSSDLLEMTNT